MPFLFGREPNESIYREQLAQKLGEITATLQAFREDLGELKTSATKLANAQSASSNDRRTQQQVVISRIEAIERTTSGQHITNTAKLDTLTAEIAAMKGPVGQYVNLRARISTIFLAAGSVVAILWAFAEPLYTYVVTKMFSGH
jgi:chromosome segregation ATPase